MIRLVGNFGELYDRFTELYNSQPKQYKRSPEHYNKKAVYPLVKSTKKAASHPD
jgi:hypothetical protein